MVNQNRKHDVSKGSESSSWDSESSSSSDSEDEKGCGMTHNKKLWGTVLFGIVAGVALLVGIGLACCDCTNAGVQNENVVDEGQQPTATSDPQSARSPEKPGPPSAASPGESGSPPASTAEPAPQSAASPGDPASPAASTGRKSGSPPASSAEPPVPQSEASPGKSASSAASTATKSGSPAVPTAEPASPAAQKPVNPVSVPHPPKFNYIATQPKNLKQMKPFDEEALRRVAEYYKETVEEYAHRKATEAQIWNNFVKKMTTYTNAKPWQSDLDLIRYELKNSTGQIHFIVKRHNAGVVTKHPQDSETYPYTIQIEEMFNRSYVII